MIMNVDHDATLIVGASRNDAKGVLRNMIVWSRELNMLNIPISLDAKYQSFLRFYIIVLVA